MPKHIGPEQNLLADFKMNAAIKGAPGVSLRDTLDLKTNDELRKLAKGYFLKGYSKLGKSGLEALSMTLDSYNPVDRLVQPTRSKGKADPGGSRLEKHCWTPPAWKNCCIFWKRRCGGFSKVPQKLNACRTMGTASPTMTFYKVWDMCSLSPT